ncbi:MAG: TRAP transporter small permease subunit [Gammaproteobacteria bacterium]|nr:TRAP transporter small permease subunit [Gammaproteobacteria bacterium]
MHKTAQGINNFIDWTGRVVSWLTLGMVLVTFIVVCLRYIFDLGSIAVQESISYMHALVFLIGAAYTLKYDEHVRVDIFYAKLSHKGRAWVDFLGSSLILFPVMIFIFWISWEYVLDSWSVMEGSRETGGLPGIFLLKSSMLLMASLLIMQGMAKVLLSLATILESDSY